MSNDFALTSPEALEELLLKNGGTVDSDNYTPYEGYKDKYGNGYVLTSFLGGGTP